MRGKSKVLLALATGVLVAGLAVVSVSAQAGPGAQGTPRAGAPAAGADWTCPMLDGTGAWTGPMGGMGVMGGVGMGAMWNGENVAKALGMTAADIAAEMRGGKSLAQIAAAKGVSNEALVNAALADHQVVLDQAVAAGRLTAEQAAAMTERMKTQIQSMLENGAAGPMGFGRGGMMGGYWQNQDGTQNQAPLRGPGMMGRYWQNQDSTQTPAPRMGPGMMGGYWQNQDGAQTPAPRMGPGMMGRAGIRG